MIKAVVTFWGTSQDELGMPIPYHSYYVISSPGQTPDSGIASVLPLSTNAPLSNQHAMVLQGGERSAFEKAIKALACEPSNIGLKQNTHEG